MCCVVCDTTLPCDGARTGSHEQEFPHGELSRSHLILEASWFIFNPIWEVEEARHQGDDQDLHGSCLIFNG